MANIKVSDTELTAILNELESDLGDLLGSAAGKLAKSREEDEGSAAGSAPAAASASAEGGEGSAPAPEASASAAPPAPEASAPAPEASAAPAPDAAAAPEADAGMEQGPVDPAALEAEYAKLPPEELKAHYLAAKAALFAVMGGASAGAPAGAPPDASASAAPVPPGASAAPAPSAVPPPPPAPSAPAAGPSATPVDPTLGKAAMPSNPNGSLGKSEVDDLKAQVATMAKALSLLAGSPMRKAITDLSYVPKAGEEKPAVKLTKGEVLGKLKEVTRNPSLQKSDRDLINRYCEGGVDVSAIEHLLK